MGVTAEDVEEALPRLFLTDVSLDDPNKSTHLPSEANQEEQYANSEELAERRSKLALAMSSLGAREQLILQARHLAETPMTLDSLGKKLRLSRERIRQLEHRAIAQLKRAFSK